MAKEEVLEVVEEPTNTEETEEELSPWYVFCSTGCGFCKKSEPVIEELNNEGYDILTLDLSEPDNQALNKELQEEYGARCGTPWFINADTGKQICGYRDKNVLLKWLAGEDIPEPPRPTGPPPRIPFHGSTNEENITWKGAYNKWLKDNKHMGDDWVKNQRTAAQILDNPRAKSDPPRPPMGQDATLEQVDKWGVELSKWQKENSHLPNHQPVDQVVQNFKNRIAAGSRNVPQAGVPVGGVPVGGVVDDTKLNTLNARVQALEVKLDRIISHFGVK